jgi:hypothetical protein
MAAKEVESCNRSVPVARVSVPVVSSNSMRCPVVETLLELIEPSASRKNIVSPFVFASTKQPRWSGPTE